MIVVTLHALTGTRVDLKPAALKKEAYSLFTAAIVGAPVSELWDLLEAAFGG